MAQSLIFPGSRSAAKLRLLLPAPLKPVAKAARNSVDPLLIRRYRATSGDGRPIPPSRLRARTGSPGIGLFFDSARQSVDDLVVALEAAGRSLSDLDAVLDFGCGCGRILQELRWRSDGGPTLFGCDVDADAIAWAQRSYPDLRLASTGFSPPLPYREDDFDLVYSSSVFTHLDAAAQQRWLEEFKRVLRPGGLALISVYGEHAFRGYQSGELLGVSRDFRERLSRYESLDSAGIVFEPYARSAWNNFNFVGVAEVYGITFDGEAYVRREWSKSLDVSAVLPRSWWSSRQDLVILRKPSTTGAERLA
jgi:SAM-dependent methyltransferase